MKNKVLSVILVLVLIVSLTACGNNGGNTGTSPSPTGSSSGTQGGSGGAGGQTGENGDTGGSGGGAGGQTGENGGTGGNGGTGANGSSGGNGGQTGENGGTGGNDSGGGNGDTTQTDNSELHDMMDKVLENVGELPMLGSLDLDAENFPYYAFIDYIDGSQAVVSEALIGSIAHSVVLLKLPEDVNPEKVAQDIRDNANPRKWVCVEAEKTTVTVNGQYVLLVMSFNDTTDAITENFKGI